MAKIQSMHEQWSSRWAFILAATGSAVGLGNIWKFPYIAGENGGGFFVLTYLFCIVLLGLPLMMSEILLGRRGRQNPVDTLQDLAIEAGASPQWKQLGKVAIWTGILILSYYSVIAGWTLAYVFRVGSGAFNGAGAEFSLRVFNELIADPERLLGWHTLFMVMTVVVVSRGVKNGLEMAVKLLMPTLFFLLLVMVVYAMRLDKFGEGVAYLFVLDRDALVGKHFFNDIFLPALGQAFFSLSLGMGAIMIYGSYLSRQTSITTAAVGIVAADTLVAILAGVAIFPMVFNYGLEPAQGPGLIFISLPIAFGHMPYGSLLGTLFFFLLMFAAWTSAISLIESGVSWLIENKAMNRVMAATLIGFVIWALGLLTILSLNYWRFEFSFAGQTKQYGIFDILDILTANILLPLVGLLLAIFVGWVMPASSSLEELSVKHACLYRTWRILVRYIVPSGVSIILLGGLGFFG